MASTPSWAIGIFRGFAAVTGIIATLYTPSLIRSFGLVKTGITSIFMHAFFVGLSVFFFFAFQYGKQVLPDTFQTTLDEYNLPRVFLYLFMACVVVSRIGLWSFDLVHLQIMQLGVVEADRGAVNSIEKSLENASEMMTMVLAALITKPELFAILIAISSVSVLLCMVLFLGWTCTRNSARLDVVCKAVSNNNKEKFDASTIAAAEPVWFSSRFVEFESTNRDCNQDKLKRKNGLNILNHDPDDENCDCNDCEKTTTTSEHVGAKQENLFGEDQASVN